MNVVESPIAVDNSLDPNKSGDCEFSGCYKLKLFDFKPQKKATLPVGLFVLV